MKLGISPEFESRYAEALGWLYGLPDLERQTLTAEMRGQMTLERPARLLAMLGHPDREYPSILIGGSKGKGSTAAMLASILQAAGHKTGFYSKPHLHTYRERIRVDGRLITKAHFTEEIDRLRPLVEQLEREAGSRGRATTFEVTTVMALDYFARQKVQAAVVEVGLGGRLDATNVLEAVLSIITPISYEHTAVLGNTLTEIAGEKAGIIKTGRPVLVSRQEEEAMAVFRSRADLLGSVLGAAGRDWVWQGGMSGLLVASNGAREGLWAHPWEHSRLTVPLLGPHQLENGATAVAAAELLSQREALEIDHSAIANGLANTRWPGRLEVAVEAGPGRAAVIIDGAHNRDSAERLWQGLVHHFQFDRLQLVLAVYEDKDLADIVAPLKGAVARAWTARTHQPRCRPAAEVAADLRTMGIDATAAESTADAIQRAHAAASRRDLVCITGSLSVVAEAREALGLVGEDERD